MRQLAKTFSIRSFLFRHSREQAQQFREHGLQQERASWVYIRFPLWGYFPIYFSRRLSWPWTVYALWYGCCSGLPSTNACVSWALLSQTFGCLKAVCSPTIFQRPQCWPTPVYLINTGFLWVLKALGCPNLICSVQPLPVNRHLW